MDVTSRSYLTAGVAALSVGAIALSPIQPIPNQMALAPERTVSNLAVELASLIDPWADAFGTAVENGQRLNDAWNARAFPIFQQIAMNQLTYASEFPKIGVITKQIINNIGNAIKAPLVEDPTNISATPTTVAYLGQTPIATLSQQTIYALLQSEASPLPPELLPIVDFMTTPLSGAILAGIGPVIGPVLSMAASIKATFAALKDRNLQAAFTEFMNLAPNAVNAFLNGGQILDLTNILNRISPLPPEVKSIGLNMGGLVSSGLTPVAGQTSEGVSGVMFDGLAADATIKLGLVSVTANDPGLSVGPIGATQLLTKRIADAIKVTPPTTAAAVAPAAAEVAALEASAPAEEAAPAADEAPAPKRKMRAAARADNGDHSGRAARKARQAD